MERLTVLGMDGRYSVTDDEINSAIQKLGLFEDAYDDLIASIERIPSELEEMRVQGKEKTVRYKETVAQKLINNSILAFFERHGFNMDYDKHESN